MKLTALMWMGTLISIVALSGSLMGYDMTLFAFAGGAVFGKGYGAWEGRDDE